MAAHADDLHVGSEVGASSAATWLAHTTKVTRATAHRTVALGHALEAHSLTRESLAKAEAHLVAQAAEYEQTFYARPRTDQSLVGIQ